MPPADVALAIDVFEYVEDYYGFLRGFRVKGHHKIFHIPLDLSAQTVMRGSPLSTLRASMGHIHFFTKETALGALAHTGYEVIDWFYSKGSLELPHSWKVDLLRIPRRLLFALNQDWTVRTLGGFSMLVLTR